MYVLIYYTTPLPELLYNNVRIKIRKAHPHLGYKWGDYMALMLIHNLSQILTLFLTILTLDIYAVILYTEGMLIYQGVQYVAHPFPFSVSWWKVSCS